MQMTLLIALGVLSVALGVALIVTRLKLSAQGAVVDDATLEEAFKVWGTIARDLQAFAGELSEAVGDGAIAYLQVLDKALDAWRKADRLSEALAVLKRLIGECSTFILRPDLRANDYGAIAEIGSRALRTYTVVSKAAGEPKDGAIKFLSEIVGKLKAVPTPSGPVNGLIMAANDALSDLSAPAKA